MKINGQKHEPIKGSGAEYERIKLYKLLEFSKVFWKK